MNPEANNAVAGPSNLRSFSRPSSPSTPQLFLPPPGPPQLRPCHLSSTQDLLTRFNLLSAYDKYVRPFAPPVDGSSDIASVPPLTPGGSSSMDKGKGRDVTGLQDADGGDGDEDGEGGKKKRNNYKHLIKGLPGKHSSKKDDYLFTMMQIPPKQRIQIQHFDQRTQTDAFAVSLEGIKGWNPAALLVESAQAREDRKKRKELKRLQKAQAQGLANPTVAQPQPVSASPPATASTPRPSNPTGTPRPGSTAPSMPTPVQRPGSTAPIQRPGSAVPRPGSTKPTPTKPTIQVPAGKVGTPLKSGISLDTPIRSPATMTPQIPSSNTWPMDAEKRGVKRDREEMSPALPSTNGTPMVNGNGVANPQASKAGSGGVRPRPIKKQRMDIPGQGLSVTQQPTPQGV